MELLMLLLVLLSIIGLCAAKDKAVVLVVDPYWDDLASFGANVPLLSQFKVVKVQTRRGSSFSFAGGGHIELYREFVYDSDAPNTELATAEICPRLKNMGVPVEAVIPTSDPSVALTDHLAACLGVRGNPSTGPLAKARRNKWIMGESVKKAGLRTMKEKVVSSWGEAKEYLDTWEPPVSERNPVIFKILNGAGGEGVVEVRSLSQAKSIFEREHAGYASQGAQASATTSILIQEYLHGKEYAVDSVSRDGVHKVIAVWFEDFRPANGIFDQYFGFKQLDPKDPFTQVIINYGTKVLDATGLRNGAANTEIKFLENENVPCLVEINARWAGIGWHDGLAVERATVGQDQYNAAFAAYLDEKAFNAMPAVYPLKQYGAVVFTVNYQAGMLRRVPGLKVAKELPSYLDSAFDSGAGLNKLIPKTSPSTGPLNIALASTDKAVLDADYARLIDLEYAKEFFDVATVMHGASFTELQAGQKRVAASWLLALMVLATLTVAGAVVMRLRRVRHDTQDEAWYLAIE